MPVLRDATELGYAGRRPSPDLGPIGGGLNRGYSCHNSPAFDPRRHEALGLANQALHRRRPVGRPESVRAKRERADRESRLWVDGGAAVGPPPGGGCWPQKQQCVGTRRSTLTELRSRGPLM